MMFQGYDNICRYNWGQIALGEEAGALFCWPAEQGRNLGEEIRLNTGSVLYAEIKAAEPPCPATFGVIASSPKRRVLHPPQLR